MLETLDHTIRIGSTLTFLYFDLYLYSAYAAHYVYFNFKVALKIFYHAVRVGHTCKFTAIHSNTHGKFVIRFGSVSL